MNTHDIAPDGVLMPRTLTRPDGSRLVHAGSGRWVRQWQHSDGVWRPYPVDRDDLRQVIDSNDTYYAGHDDRSDLDDARWLVWAFVGAFIVVAALFAWGALT